MASETPHLSIKREIEAIEEAVALKTIRACAAWLRANGHPDLADRLLAAMIEEDPAGE